MKVAVDLLGYTTWGCIDLVSNGTGEVKKRYGFIYVDRDNLGNGTYQRIKKDSFYWYQKVIESNGEKYFKKFYVTSNIPKKDISYLEENENMDILYLKDKSEVNLSNLKVIDANNLKESLENIAPYTPKKHIIIKKTFKYQFS